ncbi:MAG: DUF1570 domain-containing protein [Candidatus Omnitrophica bacterium]|nr:DUF1570 domain-containing protein [Candidatus Omnitrophota bacterium]
MRILVPFLAIAGLLAGGYWYLRAHPEILPSNINLHPVIQSSPSAQKTPAKTSSAPSQKPPVSKPKPKAQPRAKNSGVSQQTKPSSPPPDPAKQVTLFLANGGAVTGELVSETAHEVTLRWEYGDVSFQRSEIKQLIRGKEGTGEDGLVMPWEAEHSKIDWSYQNDVVIKLMRGTVVDAKIVDVKPNEIFLQQILPNGGSVEHTIARKDVEQLLFKPVQNERSKAIEESLKTIFPKMSWYAEGLFTIVTDSTPPTVREYRRTVRELATEWYLAFFPLLKNRSPSAEHYIVVFEDLNAYATYALTDGVPGWLAVGYFNPEDQVLYCFNVVGGRFSELLYEAYLGRFRGFRDQVENHFKDSRYQETVSGQLSEFLQKLEQAHAMVRQFFTDMGVDTLRHEMTHELFHNWGLQGIALSQMAEEGTEKAQKKRQFLESSEPKEKRKILDELLLQQSKDQIPQMQADNSWYIEGLAGYMEPRPLGSLNLERLAELQEAQTKKQILPLEFLDTFRMGSFIGLSTESALYAYAQSWAFCHFLMNRYPQGFLAYMEKVARDKPKKEDDTLSWLVKALGKEQRLLEAEFVEYMSQFPKEDPYWLKRMQSFIDLENELTALANRLWG